MGFRSVTLLGIALIVSMSFAQGQQQQQAPVSSAAGQEQSEISTVGTDAAIKVRVNLVLVRVVVRDGAGKVVRGECAGAGNKSGEIHRARTH